MFPSWKFDQCKKIQWYHYNGSKNGCQVGLDLGQQGHPCDWSSGIVPCLGSDGDQWIDNGFFLPPPIKFTIRGSDIISTWMLIGIGTIIGIELDGICGHGTPLVIVDL